MPPIEVVYENGVFRPLQPVELPEGATGAVVLAGVAGGAASIPTAVLDHAQGPYQSPADGENGANDTSAYSADDPRVAGHDAESPGQRAYRLLMEIADLPHAASDGRTDISVQHDSILYPKQGRMP